MSVDDGNGNLIHFTGPPPPPSNHEPPAVRHDTLAAGSRGNPGDVIGGLRDETGLCAGCSNEDNKDLEGSMSGAESHRSQGNVESLCPHHANRLQREEDKQKRAKTALP